MLLSPDGRRLFVANANRNSVSVIDLTQELAVDEIDGSPIPLSKAATSPITHVISIVKENRTYDQVLGDMPEGHGDPTLCLFPERVTPNHHALARQFVLLDNFYVESEVSADGHEWTMGAYQAVAQVVFLVADRMTVRCRGHASHA